MPPINIRKELYERAIIAKVDVVKIANDAVEQYLNEHKDEQ
jgi:hypothetical protein